MVKLSSDVIVALLSDLYAANQSLKPISGKVVKRKAIAPTAKVAKRVAPTKIKKEKALPVSPVQRAESVVLTPVETSTPTKAKKPRKRLAKTAQTQKLEIHTGDDSSELFPFNWLY